MQRQRQQQQPDACWSLRPGHCPSLWPGTPMNRLKMEPEEAERVSRDIDLQKGRLILELRHIKIKWMDISISHKIARCSHCVRVVLVSTLRSGV